MAEVSEKRKVKSEKGDSKTESAKIEAPKKVTEKVAVKKEAVEKEVAPKVKKVAKKVAQTEKPEAKVASDAIKKTKLDRMAKKYKAVAVKIEKDKEYTLEEAVKLAKETAVTKFDSSVEIHLNLNTDPKNPEHALRGSVSLPAGLGKSKKVAVVCGADKEKEAKEAGADIIGGKELIEKIAKGDIDFEVLVATPDMMPELAKAGKILGPKGLMPNPKDNTVTTDIKATIDDIKKGRAEYRSDSYGIIHSVIGKASFAEDKLLENAEAFLSVIHSAKPGSVKGTFVKSIYLATTMGPSIKIKE